MQYKAGIKSMNIIKIKVPTITQEIVNITKNEKTSFFVGKPLHSRETKRGTIYAIGNTDYFLTQEEYDLFLQSNCIQTKTVLIDSDTQQVLSKSTIHKLANLKVKASNLVHKPAQDAPNQEKKATEETENEARITSSYTFGATHDKLLDTSKFLLEYPSPDFSVDEPKTAVQTRSLLMKIKSWFQSLTHRKKEHEKA